MEKEIALTVTRKGYVHEDLNRKQYPETCDQKLGRAKAARTGGSGRYSLM